MSFGYKNWDKTKGDTNNFIFSVAVAIRPVKEKFIF